MNPGSNAVQRITSRANELVVRLRRMAAQPAAYRREGVLWIEGEHLCQALCERGHAAQTAVVNEQAWESRADLRALAAWAPRVVLLPPAVFEAVSALESPPPIGFVVPHAGLLQAAPLAGRSALVLDRLQDPGNAGTLLRTAAAFGVPQVLALSGTVALWSPKVLRAAMGAHFGLHLVEGLSLEQLQPLAPQLVVTTLRDGEPLHASVLPQAPAWVMGHEGGGVAPELQALAGCRVTITQALGQESLNVAAAAAICLYEQARRTPGPQAQ